MVAQCISDERTSAVHKVRGQVDETGALQNPGGRPAFLFVSLSPSTTSSAPYLTPSSITLLLFSSRSHQDGSDTVPVHGGYVAAVKLYVSSAS